MTGSVSVNPADWAYGVPPYGVNAVTLNVTATNATQNTYVSVYGPSAISYPYRRPDSSNLNLGPGQTVANAVTTGALEGVEIRSHSGNADFIADLTGYFTDTLG